MAGLRLAVPVLAVAAVSLPGCGDNSETTTAPAARPSAALTELQATRTGLAGALATYASGDRAAAERQVGDAYLEHFEHVEGALAKVDEELNETIEEQLAHELRDKMKAGAPGDEVHALGRRIEKNLVRAKAELE